MKPPSLNAFYEGLYRTQDYETPAGPAPLMLDRIFGRFDWWYYLRLVKIVSAGSLYAYRGQYTTEAWASCAYRILTLIEGCGGRISVTDLRPVFLAGERPMVYVGNHMSLIETMLIPLFLLRCNYITPVIKTSLLKYPGFGKILQTVRAINVDRKNPRDDLKQVLLQGQDRLKEGRSVLIFPQSTRTDVFDPSQFNSLGVKLAKKAGVPVVPVAVKTDFQGNGKRFKDLGPLDRSKKLHFRFGPIMNPTNSRETHEQIVEFIKTNLDKWTQEDNRRP